MRVLKLAFFVFLLLSTACLLFAESSAETVVYGDTTYFYPSQGAIFVENAALTISMQYQSIDMDTFEEIIDPAQPGAVFGVYAKGADGAFIPFPNPDDPLTPWLIPVDEQPVAVAVPQTVDLYIKQEIAPDGYLPDDAEYRPLNPPEALTIVNYARGAQGVQIHVTGKGPEGEVALPDVRFMMEGAGTAHSLVTDENGVITLLGIPAGDYTLTQETGHEGYHFESPETLVTVLENRAIRVDIANNRGGSLAVYPTGIIATVSAEGEFVEERMPLESRVYEVLDEAGESHGLLAYGQKLDLPATEEGTVYLLRQHNTTNDGFAADKVEHAAVLHAGEAVASEPTVKSGKGFFSLTVTPETGETPVEDGIFTIYSDAGMAVMTFKLEEDGTFIPRAPIAPGVYTLRMASAPSGFMYTDHTLRFQIRPYLTDEKPITELAYAAKPIPAELLSPVVVADAKQLPSVFEEDVQFDFALSLQGQDDFPLPISDLTFEVKLPKDPAIRLVRELPTGARVDVFKRLPIPGTKELSELTVQGSVYYTFSYLSAANTFTEQKVSAPFSVSVATFEKLQVLPEYSRYGHVKDVDGNPASGVRVALEDPSAVLVFAETVTDPYGVYAFAKAEAEKAATSSVVRFYPAPGYGALVEGDDAIILQNQTRRGRLVAHGDISLADVSVSIGSMPSQRPGENGRFSFDGVFLPTDTFDVKASEPVAERIEEGASETLIHLYPAASVSGVVADMDNNLKISGVTVMLTGEEGTHTQTTALGGAFQFERLVAGDYTLSVEPSDEYLPAANADLRVSLEMGEALALDPIDLRRPGTVEGRIQGETGALAGTAVTLLPVGLETKTDEVGAFTFPGLPLGEYTLSIDLPEDTVLTAPLGVISLEKSGARSYHAISLARPATIAGLVFSDINDDGIFAQSEPGLSSVEVALIDSDGEEAQRTRTDAGGNFAFADIAPGSYSVSVQLPPNMIFARAAKGTETLIAGVDSAEGASEYVALPPGETINVVCGAVTSGMVSGVVFDDHDGDGLYDEGEPLIAGVQAALLLDDEQIASTKTDEGGRYQFGGLRAGEYAVRMTLPESSVFTRQSSDLIGSSFPALDSRIGTVSFSVSHTRMESVINAGVLRTTAIVTHVWLDENADGDTWNEDGYSGLLASLYVVNEGGESLIASEVTDADGNASFDDLRPGTYRVHYQLPDEAFGFTAGGLALSGDVGIGPDCTVGNSGETETAPVGIAKLGSISGVVFSDVDYDGIRADTDRGLSGTAVYLLDEEGEIVLTTLSEANGDYAFTGVLPGSYTVRFELPSGYTFTVNREDAPSFRSDVPQTAGTTGESAQVYLPMGEKMLINCGAYKTSSISGAVWHDAEGTGIYAAGNTPLSDIDVELLRDDELYLGVRTGSDGAYLFDSVPPGEYVIRVTLPEGMYFSEKRAESGRGNCILPTQGNVGRTAPILLEMNAQEKGIDAAIVYTGSVKGFVYDIQTGDESGENFKGAEGIVVRLTRENEPDVETVTETNGSYLFEGIRAGEAEITFDPADEWIVDSSQEETLTIEVPQNETLMVEDAFVIHETVIDGRIWLDANQNREMDEGEEPVEGAVVALLQHDDDESAEAPREPSSSDGSPAAPTAEEIIEAELAAEAESGVAWSASVSMDYVEEEEEQEGDMIAITGSDADGSFYFGRLQAGNYSIRIVPPSGILLYSGEWSTVSELPVGEAVNFVAPAYVAGYIRGTIWEDDNNDGLYTSDERLLEGVTVQLVDLDGAVLLERQSDNEGNYMFNELPPGSYTVRVRLPEGYVFSRPVEGGSTILQANGHSEASTSPIAVQMGDRVNNMNAGGMRTARIGNTVWLDENGNGLIDTAEAPVSGLSLSLWRVASDGMLEFVTETQTDMFGHYRLENIRPGYYQITLTLGEDYIPTRQVEELDLINSKLPFVARPQPSTEVFLLRSGEDMTNMNFGIVTRSIADSLSWEVDSGSGAITAR